MNYKKHVTQLSRLKTFAWFGMIFYASLPQTTSAVTPLALQQIKRFAYTIFPGAVRNTSVEIVTVQVSESGSLSLMPARYTVTPPPGKMLEVNSQSLVSTPDGRFLFLLAKLTPSTPGAPGLPIVTQDWIFQFKVLNTGALAAAAPGFQASGPGPLSVSPDSAKLHAGNRIYSITANGIETAAVYSGNITGGPCGLFGSALTPTLFYTAPGKKGFVRFINHAGFNTRYIQTCLFDATTGAPIHSANSPAPEGLTSQVPNTVLVGNKLYYWDPNRGTGESLYVRTINLDVNLTPVASSVQTLHSIPPTYGTSDQTEAFAYRSAPSTIFMTGSNSQTPSNRILSGTTGSSVFGALYKKALPGYKLGLGYFDHGYLIVRDQSSLRSYRPALNGEIPADPSGAVTYPNFNASLSIGPLALVKKTINLTEIMSEKN